MNDFIDRLYNGFLLRDLLGYVIPGGFVFLCMVHLIAVMSGLTLETLSESLTSSGLIYFASLGLCYACGHFLSGVFFHMPPFGNLFKYSPDALQEDYPDCTFDEAWVAHRVSYRASCAGIENAMQSLIERHAALVHFTGHFSAALIFTALYLTGLSAYQRGLDYLVYLVPLIVIFPGIYSHYRRLVFERYQFERSALRDIRPPSCGPEAC